MITNAMEFPCMEATRCYIAEKEHGLRLCYTAGKKGNPGTLGFTSSRTPAAEWYVYMETRFSSQNGSGEEQRILQLGHCQTGHFLCCIAKGEVGLQAKPSKDTKWVMENNEDQDCNASFNLRSSLGELLRIVRPDPEKQKKKNKLIPDALIPGALVQGGLIPAVISDYQLSTMEFDDDAGFAGVFELEFTSGELCFISNPIMHNQIRCNPIGQLSMTQNFACQEVWRFIEVGNGHLVIATWSHAQTFYLSSDADGNVFTTRNRLGHHERWYLERAENGARIVSVAHKGRYLSIGRGEGETFRTTTQPNDYAKWHMEAAHSNTYHLHSISASTKGEAAYISSDRKGKPSLSKQKRDWEEWKLERFDDDYITLYSTKHEQYLGSNSMGEVMTTKKIGEWSLWSIEQSTGYGGVHLMSKTYQRRLAVVGEEDNITLCTTRDECSNSESWRLEPCLPFFLSPTKIAAMASAGVLGLALTVAMPYALLGIVEVGYAEAAGLAALRLFVGGGMVGATGVCVVDRDPSAKMPSSPTAREDYLTASCRPICAWKNW